MCRDYLCQTEPSKIVAQEKQSGTESIETLAHLSPSSLLGRETAEIDFFFPSLENGFHSGLWMVEAVIQSRRLAAWRFLNRRDCLQMRGL
jgi:hypothetical protein